jgi:hypothetical protein
MMDSILILAHRMNGPGSSFARFSCLPSAELPVRRVLAMQAPVEPASFPEAGMMTISPREF